MDQQIKIYRNANRAKEFVLFMYGHLPVDTFYQDYTSWQKSYGNKGTP